MTLITTTASKQNLEAIKELVLKSDPDATFESYDDENYLSKEDQQNLIELYEAHKRGELEYMTMEEFDQRSKEFLKRLSSR
ncbi:hypothetical protein [Helicobacter sp. 11S02629-2]|uniref:hypothetical protein n=1 Tax=Helicobacter sp. 11S02629-2 TaxID=1476195 RepID=UPI000BA5D5B3|nr:hypothetical protein [Helicobacter sp. 11S02629-2]PAF44378.1 hypothetical protein BKH40_05640 [Helicobacter sp. 11S02629-2]